MRREHANEIGDGGPNESDLETAKILQAMREYLKRENDESGGAVGADRMPCGTPGPRGAGYGTGSDNCNQVEEHIN